ncbi:MAG: hypothetical protein O3A31_08170 [Planctomycetota bacterium]|nr:hypothetical protein [Planctomycetota bacterium]
MLSPRNTADAIPPNKEDHTMLLDDLTIVLFTSCCIAICLGGFQILDRRGVFRSH